MRDSNAPVPDGFMRSLRHWGDRKVIESVCQYCGLRIIGSVTAQLIQDEAQHRQACHLKAAAAARG